MGGSHAWSTSSTLIEITGNMRLKPMAVGAQRPKILWQVVRIVPIHMVNVELTSVNGNKTTLLAHRLFPPAVRFVAA